VSAQTLTVTAPEAVVSIEPVAVVNHLQSAKLQIDWKDGRQSWLSHQLLRQACRCAACMQVRRSAFHLADPGKTLGQDTFKEASLKPEVRLSNIASIGTQGLQLGFSDGHALGIFPWSYLRSLDE
jgi:DUF971 family protein